MLTDVADNHRDPSARPDVGHLFIMIDASKLMPPDALAQRMDHASDMAGSARPVPRGAAPRLPGARAVAALKRARAVGMDVLGRPFERAGGAVGVSRARQHPQDATPSVISRIA